MTIRRHRVRTSRELEALASPERQDIVQALHGRPPLSVPEIAALVGRLPVSLYYHLRALERAGLLVRAGTRAAARGTEALYAIPAAQIAIEPEVRGPREVAAMRRIGAGMLRRAQRLHDALVAEAPARRRLRREHLLAQRTIRLDREGLERVNVLLLELVELLARKPSTGAAGAFYTVTLHLARDSGRSRRSARAARGATPRRAARTR